jgi:predicted flap endonuclease-1-like 5' DNA nuclease
MVTNGISGSASTPSATTTTAGLTPSTPEAATTPAASNPETLPPKHDTVELTGTALAKSLKMAGQTPAQIALKMGLDVKTVDGYLGVATKAATTATLPPPITVAPQVEQATSGTATPAATNTSQG